MRMHDALNRHFSEKSFHVSLIGSFPLAPHAGIAVPAVGNHRQRADL